MSDCLPSTVAAKANFAPLPVSRSTSSRAGQSNRRDGGARWRGRRRRRRQIWVAGAHLGRSLEWSTNPTTIVIHHLHKFVCNKATWRARPPARRKLTSPAPIGGRQLGSLARRRPRGDVGSGGGGAPKSARSRSSETGAPWQGEGPARAPARYRRPALMMMMCRLQSSAWLNSSLELVK